MAALLFPRAGGRGGGGVEVLLYKRLMGMCRWMGLHFYDSIDYNWPGGWTPHMKGVGMLVVSLRGVNFGSWSHLGCFGQNAIILSREGLV